MTTQDIMVWDLKEIADTLIREIPIHELYLFGSRAYRTNSLRSDIDLLAILHESEIVNEAEINAWLPIKYPPVDLFLSYDGKRAKSVGNGSTIVLRKVSFDTLSKQLDAVKLWSENDSFSDNVQWEQKALKDIPFAMSIIPGKWRDDEAHSLELAFRRIEESGIHVFFTGSTIREVSETILQIIETGMEKPKSFQTRARSFSFNSIKLVTEYDLQNYVHLLLRSVFSDIEREPFMVRIDGNDKNADFALNKNQIVLEIKWVDTASKKDAVIKTLDGLQSFYKEHPQVKSLLFIVFYDDKAVKLDDVVLRSRYEKAYTEPPIFVRFIRNVYK